MQQRSSFAESSASNNFASPSAVGRRQIKNKYIERRRNKDKVRYKYRYRYRGRDVFQ